MTSVGLIVSTDRASEKNFFTWNKFEYYSMEHSMKYFFVLDISYTKQDHSYRKRTFIVSDVNYIIE